MTEIRQPRGLVDGMGGECLVPSGTAYQRDTEPLHPYFVGSLTTSSNITAAQTIRGGTISGDQLHSDILDTTVWVSGPTIVGNNISGTNIRVGGEGVIHSVAIENATQLFGYRVVAGSVLTDTAGVGAILFPSAGSFSTANYFLTLTPRDWTHTAVSGVNFAASGTRRASGCAIIGGSTIVVDWIAVGI